MLDTLNFCTYNYYQTNGEYMTNEKEFDFSGSHRFRIDHIGGYRVDRLPADEDSRNIETLLLLCSLNQLDLRRVTAAAHHDDWVCRVSVRILFVAPVESGRAHSSRGALGDRT